MNLDPSSEIDRMAANFEAEAMGETDWLGAVFGEDPVVCRMLTAVALERAAMRLRVKAHPNTRDTIVFGPVEMMGQ